MAGVRNVITVDGRRAKRAMVKLVDAGADTGPAFEEIGSALLTSTQQRFEDEQSPTGKSWKALSPATQDRPTSRNSTRGGDHILRHKGLLAGSITYLASRNDVALGSNRVQAAIHQLGGTDDMAPGPAGIPARPYLGVSREDEGEIGEILRDYFDQATS